MHFAFGGFPVLAVLVAFSTFGQATGAAFLNSNGGRHDLDEGLRSAMASVMGCGASPGSSPSRQIDAAKSTLYPMWETLPKNLWGNVDWKMLRYTVHRYFMQKYSLLVKGFEPTRLVNSSVMGAAGILSREADSLVDASLQGKADGRGFSIDDVALVVATLERVIHDGERARLERAYLEMGHRPHRMLAHDSLSSVIETYVMLWMLDDEESISLVLKEPALKHELWPMWHDVQDFAAGMVKKMEFEAAIAPHGGQGRAAFQRSYSFEDAHQAVGHITRNFASFWEAECQTIKQSLVGLDKLGIGRVAISDFYGANADGEWRFGESETYLRELGAIDETSNQRGKQVIIPNYLLGASNCIVTTQYYMVCCINECEDVLNDIEGAVGAPAADVETLLGLAKNMTTYNDESPSIEGELTQQLRRVSEMHAGQIPLHGRLFAQWLHYVFPRECPYPHKAGAATAASVFEFGDDSFVSEDDVRAHSANRHLTSQNISDVEEAQWMSQWSEEEELAMDYNIGPAPWELTGSWLIGGCGAMAMVGLAWNLMATAVKELKSTGSQPVSAKSQFV